MFYCTPLPTAGTSTSIHYISRTLGALGCALIHLHALGALGALGVPSTSSVSTVQTALLATLVRQDSSCIKQITRFTIARQLTTSTIFISTCIRYPPNMRAMHIRSEWNHNTMLESTNSIISIEDFILTRNCRYALQKAHAVQKIFELLILACAKAFMCATNGS